jgi:hypothetical protein
MYCENIYRFLIDKKILKINHPVFFKYRTDSGEELYFDAVVKENGLELDGEIHSPSSAAALCLCKHTMDRMAVNGWLAWSNDEGLSLSQLYLRYKGEPYKDMDPHNLSRYSSYFSQDRDVTIIFGAGASMGDGAPSQAQILKRMYSVATKGTIYGQSLNEIKEFLLKAFSYDESSKNVPNLEYVFGFIDFFLSNNQSYSDYYTYRRLINIREDLIRFINHFIHDSLHGHSPAMTEFIKQIYANNTNTTVMTLNYDTLFEDSFSDFILNNFYLSYCYDLINYNYQHLNPDSWLFNPNAPMLLPKGSVPKTIKFLKLHGSLDWFYCSVCNSLMIQPLSIKKTRPGAYDGSLDGMTAKLLCPRDDTRLWSLTTPPAYKKDLTHPVISNMLIEAGNELSVSKKIVFVGYSMPEADVHIKALLARAQVDEKELFVVSPSFTEDMRYRYLQLNKKVTFIEKTFSQALKEGDFIKILQKSE